MYVAKMSGFSRFYDLFTPDVGEMDFLADEKAPHPFHTRGFLLEEEDRAVDLIRRAQKHQNAARFLLVKGYRDYVAKDGVVVDIIEEPLVESMEPNRGDRGHPDVYNQRLSGLWMPAGSGLLPGRQGKPNEGLFGSIDSREQSGRSASLSTPGPGTDFERPCCWGATSISGKVG